MAELNGRTLDLAGAFRGHRPAVVDEAKYHAFQRAEAANMGLEG